MLVLKKKVLFIMTSLRQGGAERSLVNLLQELNYDKYDVDLLKRGIPSLRIYKYGFGFEGEKCLIVGGKGENI